MKQSKYNKRYIARIVVEAATPLAVGTGEKDILTDALVARDVNGLPYIPGSSIAGVLRHSMGDINDENSIFGFQNGDRGHGSRIIFTDAVLLNSDGTALDGLNDIEKNEFLDKYKALPIRQHVRINERGTTDSGGKFDEQIVYKGSRFVFEIEMVDDGENENRFYEVLNRIYTPFFRLGSGTRSGFGELSIVDVQHRSLDLNNPEELALYVSKSSSLSESWKGLKKYAPVYNAEVSWHEYTLELKPSDFFLFSSGFNDDDADNTPVTESRVVWDTSGKGSFEEDCILIPATSVKGAIAHRVAYHWNKIMNYTIENGKGQTGDNNEAVANLFGCAGDNNDFSRGNVILSDLFLSHSKDNDKIFNHVTIDRITGGTIDGHLFSEKTIYGDNKSFELTLHVDEKTLNDSDIRQALEQTLKDICDGLLPLGGGTNRGHGIFTGKITKGLNNGNK